MWGSQIWCKVRLQGRLEFLIVFLIQMASKTLLFQCCSESPTPRFMLCASPHPMHVLPLRSSDLLSSLHICVLPLSSSIIYLSLQCRQTHSLGKGSCRPVHLWCVGLNSLSLVVVWRCHSIWKLLSLQSFCMLFGFSLIGLEHTPCTTVWAVQRCLLWWVLFWVVLCSSGCTRICTLTTRHTTPA